MAKKMTHVALLLVLLGAALFGMARTASADGIYHTERLDLVPVGGAPLRSGSVVNIHANGPINYAHEVYMLNGASPNTDYQVVLMVYLGDTTCSGAPQLVLPTAVISTNGVGNGLADYFIPPEAAAGLAGLSAGVRWEVMDGSTLAYQTECTAVMLD